MDLYAHYRSIRCAHPHLPARQALLWARGRKWTPSFPWDGDCRNAAWQEAVYTVSVRVVADYDAEADWLGEILPSEPADTAEAIKREDGSWYVPMDSWRDNWIALRRSRSRHDAYTTALACAHADMYRLEALGHTWGFVGVLARVSRAGVELGSASVWGVDDDWQAQTDSLMHVEDVARDVVAEAIKHARCSLERLCPGAA